MTHRAYCFTLFADGDAFDGEHIISMVGGHDEVRYVVAQLERCPTSDRLHLQGYIELRNPMRVPAASKIFGTYGPHLEPRRGSREQARDYCRKSESRVLGPFEHGTWKAGGQGKRADLAVVKEAVDSGTSLLTLWEDNFATMVSSYKAIERYRFLRESKQAGLRTVHVHVYWGIPGSGKSHKAFHSGGDVFVLSPIRGSLWFDGYDSQPNLLIDDFYGWIPYYQLLRILDKYPYACPVKGGFTPAKWTNVFITSNSSPRQWYNEEKVPDQGALARRIHTEERFTEVYRDGDISIPSHWPDGPYTACDAPAGCRG